ncbi:hypothetical protein [Bacillus sp. FJAT-45066]|uniref:hypothetical protein n=1 Tax=Bacillus sp. FJAT-45066 TaxID=2011010 RepID=UPI000BB89B29|nr:hypothetical protein [Bacillus sp. FJAT-45066]
MKKVVFGSLVVLLLVYGFVIYSYAQPGYLAGETEEWSASYVSEQSAKDIWRGDFTWEKKSGIITKYEFKKNGQTITNLVENAEIDMASTEKYSFASLGEPPVKGENYELVITWAFEGQEKVETVQLDYQNRYFVVPRFIYSFSNN